MSKRRLWKSGLSMTLALAMVMTSLSFGEAEVSAQEVQTTKTAAAKVAAEDETVGASAELLDELNFTTNEVDLGEADSNPYTTGVNKLKNLTPISELVLTSSEYIKKPSSLDKPSDPIYRLYDIEADANYNSEQANWITDGLGIGTDRFMTSDNADKQIQTDYIATKNHDYTQDAGMISEGADSDGDGRTDLMVQQILGLDFSIKAGVAKISNGQMVGTMQNLGTITYEPDFDSESDFMPEEQENTYMNVAVGDYDGDGCDEAAIYQPSTTANIKIYDLSATEGLTLKRTINLRDLEGAANADAFSDASVAPIIDMETVDIDAKGAEELALTITHLCPSSSSKESVWKNTGAYFTVLNLTKDTYTECISKRLNWTAEDYSITDANYVSKTIQAMRYVGITTGDTDDNGYDEIILAGKVASSTASSTISSTEYYRVGILRMEYNKAYAWCDGGLPYRVNVNYEGGDDTERNRNVSVVAFAGKGTGYADILFVEGRTFIYGNKGASVKNVMAMLNVNRTFANKFPSKSAASGNLKKVYNVSWTQEGSMDTGNTITSGMAEKDTVILTNVVAGNFNGNRAGQEQVLAVNSSSAVVGFIRQTVGDNESSYSTYTDANIVKTSNVDSVLVNICPVDYDIDGMVVKFKGKESYFSNPNVVAILQAAPYYKDLESVDDNYISSGSTCFGKTEGGGSTLNNEFSVSAGVITGYEEDISLLGVYDLGGVDFSVEVSANVGYANELTTSKSYSTEYESSSKNNSVVLSTTPYIRYIYEVVLPDYQIPTEDEYKQMKTDKAAALKSRNASKDQKNFDMYTNRYNNLCTQISAVESAIADGHTYGETITSDTTEYSVCIPKTPRMTMITTKQYDKVAAQSDKLDVIDGNILRNTPGDPFSYPATGGAGFDGGKVVGDVSGSVDGFIRVGSGDSNSGNTQEIVEDSERSDSVTWGASISTECVATLMGVKAGTSYGVEYGGGQTWTDFKSSSYSGRVAAIPEEVSDDYTFSWRFGTWNSTVNGKTCKILGYNVKEQDAPPALPENIVVSDSTTDSITLNWDDPTRKGVKYEVALLEDNGEYLTVGTVASKNNSYTIKSDLSSGTTYQVAMRTIGKDNSKSAWSVAQPARTKYGTGDVAPTIQTQPADTSVWENDSAEFSISARKIENSISSIGYQWQVRSASDERWQNIDGANADTLTIPSATADMEGYQYRCTVSQSYGGRTILVDSEVATLHLNTKYDTTTTMTNLAAANGVVGASVALTANVATNVSVTAITGSVKYLIKNTSTGTDSEVTANIAANTATANWTPTEAGVYQITAQYQGDAKCTRSTSETKTYIAAPQASAQTTSLFSISCADKAAYGTDLALGATLTTFDASGKPTVTPVTTASRKLKASKEATGVSITVTNGVWNVNDIAGDYYLEATYTTGGKTYTCLHALKIEKAKLVIKVADKTVDLSKTDYTDYSFDPSEVTLEGIVPADETVAKTVLTASVDQDEILLDGNNKPYNDSYSINVGFASEADTDVIAQLQSKYEIYFEEATIAYTGNVDANCTISYEAEEGGSIITAQSNLGTTITSGEQYPLGTIVILEAQPKDIYRFVGWKEGEDIVSTKLEYRFELGSDRDLTACFELAADQLLSITDPATMNVTNISLSDLIAQLPKTVAISTRDASVTSAKVSWDTADLTADYEVASDVAQHFELTGTVALPTGLGQNDVELEAILTIEVAPHAHSAGARTVTPATENRDGVITTTCTTCGEVISETTIASIDSIKLSNTSYTYNGKEKKPTVRVRDDQGVTIPASSYNVTYAAGRKNVGTYKVKITFKGNYAGTKTLSYKIVAASMGKAKVKLSKTSYTYNGKAQKPSVTVKDAKGATIAKSSYTVSYASGRKNVGKYTVKVTFKGNYKGTATASFVINPPAVKFSSVKGAKNAFTAKWKKGSQITGYELQYSTSSKFNKSLKKVNISKASTLSKKVTKLTGKKKYYVRIRTYKTIGKTKYYSGWTVKSVTTRK